MKNLTVLCADVGGSKLIVGLVNGLGRVLISRRHEWTNLSPDTMVGEIIQALRGILALRPDCVPAALGVTIPGLADPARGIWVESSFSGVRDIPVVMLLEEAINLPAFILNDIQACALAERFFGCCKDTDDFFWMTVSNGIGGAVFSGGCLVTGSRGNAGEIGHVVVADDAAARNCKCGNSGCVEIQASGRAIPQNYRELGGIGNPDAREIGDLARRGDTIALKTWQLEGVLLGKAVGAAVNLLNPAKVVIGGGVSHCFDLFERFLLNTLTDRVYQTANPRLEVLPSPLYDQAGLLGAATLALSGLHQLNR